EVKLTRQWKGSVKDEDLRKGAPEVITSAKALKHLWGTWQVSDKLPEVDFKKEIVIVVVGSGSRLNASARLDDEGNLQVLGLGTLPAGRGGRPRARPAQVAAPRPRRPPGGEQGQTKEPRARESPPAGGEAGATPRAAPDRNGHSLRSPNPRERRPCICSRKPI